MEKAPTLIDTHEFGMLIDKHSDGSFKVTAWVDLETQCVIVKGVEAAMDAAATMAQAWADGFREGPER